MAKSVVAIVGRPNVGKSTFFNRCVGARHAIVEDTAGVTRDRIYRETDWSGHDLILIDTGGVIANSKDEMSGQIYDQVALAIEEADVIVFIVDGKNGMCGADEEVANLLRRSKKPIILAVNKIDDPPDEPKAMEFYGLGLGDPVTLSAMRGSGGVGDVLDRVLEILGLDQPVKKKRKKKEYIDDLPEEEEDDELGPTSIAIVGKPNVGKSSITNLLCGKSRTIVGAEPGTTRDAIDTPIKVNGKDYVVVDTAGIRRRNKVDYGIEAFAVVRSLRALERANVCVMVLDASQEITDQDQKIASKIEEAGKAAVIVLNKWDLIEDKTSRLMNEFTERMKTELRAISYAEVVFTSAVSKQRIPKIIEAVDRAQEATRKRISTGTLNQIVNESVALVPPPASKRGKRLKVYYTTQVSVAPPTFVVFANDNKLMTRQYEVYLERKIRDSFGYVGTPVRIITRSKKDTK
ncbi:MAG: ribosome biogenesis GTPase Der [Candidatus Obscuribacterales bacterium]|nr:ribosome biogenesis GTPase Der [Candidatus Obscuribacterales bacterium]